MKTLAQFLQESSLTRVRQHFMGDNPVAIITAFRSWMDNIAGPDEKTGKRMNPDSKQFNSQKEQWQNYNYHRNEMLAKSIRNAGFGFIPVYGSWIENKGTDKEVHAKEESYLVLGTPETSDKMFKLLVSWAKLYNQDSFIFKNANTKEVGLFGKDGESIMSFASFNANQIADNYTRLRKGSHSKDRTFVFENHII